MDHRAAILVLVAGGLSYFMLPVWFVNSAVMQQIQQIIVWNLPLLMKHCIFLSKKNTTAKSLSVRTLRIYLMALQVGYFPPYVDFTAYECLKAIGRDAKAGKNYIWIEEAFDRLVSTTYKGNIFKEDESRSEVFTLINIEYIKNQQGQIDRIRMHFNQRIQESAKLRGLLTIDKTILREEAGIKKRILELVTVSMGRESSWTVGIERLQALCAHEGTLKRFKYELRQYDLPWKVTFSKAIHNGGNVTFTAKEDIPTGEW